MIAALFICAFVWGTMHQTLLGLGVQWMLRTVLQHKASTVFLLNYFLIMLRETNLPPKYYLESPTLKATWFLSLCLSDFWEFSLPILNQSFLFFFFSIYRQSLWSQFGVWWTYILSHSFRILQSKCCFQSHPIDLKPYSELHESSSDTINCAGGSGIIIWSQSIHTACSEGRPPINHFLTVSRSQKRIQFVF